MKIDSYIKKYINQQRWIFYNYKFETLECTIEKKFTNWSNFDKDIAIIKSMNNLRICIRRLHRTMIRKALCHINNTCVT